MPTIKEKLEFRYEQAKFFNTKVCEASDPFEAACHFTAFLAIFRSVVQQSEKALRLPGESNCWTRLLNPWKTSNLSMPQQKCERLLTEIRNHEIHVEPIAVEERRFGTISILDIVTVVPPFSSESVLGFEDLAGKKHRLRQTCDMGLEVIRKLLDDHFPSTN